MCDYSLHAVASRPAEVAETLARRSGTPTSSKSSRMPLRRTLDSRKTSPRAWPLSTRFWNEQGRLAGAA